VKVPYNKTIKNGRKKSKKTLEHGMISHAHGSAQLILKMADIWLN
jgi:hypothetical protein